MEKVRKEIKDLKERAEILKKTRELAKKRREAAAKSQNSKTQAERDAARVQWTFIERQFNRWETKAHKAGFTVDEIYD